MLMLCLVFAVAGPVMPGAGDVSPMDPTIAYGAAPTMLVFAPDGGAGFDLMGQDSFLTLEAPIYVDDISLIRYGDMEYVMLHLIFIYLMPGEGQPAAHAASDL